MEHRHIVLFDGVCNLCSSLVVFLVRRDTKARLRFTSLQSQTGQQLIQRYRTDPGSDSMIVISDEIVFERSKAVFRISKILGFPWNSILVFSLLGKGINDGLYNWVARNRLRWFGKKAECLVPTEAMRARFLD